MSLSSRIKGLSESLECGDGGVRGDFDAALADVDVLEAEISSLREMVRRLVDTDSHVFNQIEAIREGNELVASWEAPK